MNNVQSGKLIVDDELESLLQEAWHESRRHHGNRLTVHVPGMFVVNGTRGRYRAVSITGDRCDLDCEHCKGTLLETMPQALEPAALVDLGLAAAERGDHGMLVTGGCDLEGRLPWKKYASAIERVKSQDRSDDHRALRDRWPRHGSGSKGGGR
jgi:hypothetical protein